MITLTITDPQDSMTFDVLTAPLQANDVVLESDITTVDNNISTYHTGEKKQHFTVGVGDLTASMYVRLKGFLDRQRTNRKYPLATLEGAENVRAINMPAKLTLNTARIVDNCGLVEGVEIDLRESKQMP